MNNIIISENGQIRKFEDMELAEDIIQTKNTKGPWAMIDKMVKAWAHRAPEDVKAVEINITQYKETLEDKEFGQTLGGKQQERRFKLAFPYALQQMIRSIYKAEELPFDKDFYDEFAKRYPYFKVAQKN